MNRGLDRQEGAGRKAGDPAEGAELFAIVKTGTGDVLWADVCLAHQAEGKAYIYAINHGGPSGVRLLSGTDLGSFLLERESA